MMQFPKHLKLKLNERIQNESLRRIETPKEGVDFFSNDYLGFSSSVNIYKNASKDLLSQTKTVNGSTGSRLISGTQNIHKEVEKQLADFHNAESALLYNSGYDANVGLFSSILTKGDVLLFDELIHASVRDGLLMSNANNYKFKHNNLEDLEQKIIRFKEKAKQLYITIECVYSMDGDVAPLKEIVELCEEHNVMLIVDEAHSGGVFGEQGKGLVCELGLANKIFARVHTFGKALGCHGAIVLGSQELRTYLINFSRSFIYTTAISMHAVFTIKMAFLELQQTKQINKLKEHIIFFRNKIKELELDSLFIDSVSAIHCCLISGNTEAKKMESNLKKSGFLVKAVLSPTVPKGKERIRICLHAFNTKNQICLLLENLKNLSSKI